MLMTRSGAPMSVLRAHAVAQEERVPVVGPPSGRGRVRVDGREAASRARCRRRRGRMLPCVPATVPEAEPGAHKAREARAHTEPGTGRALLLVARASARTRARSRRRAMLRSTHRLFILLLLSGQSLSAQLDS